jgi:hypothetical protein
MPEMLEAIGRVVCAAAIFEDRLHKAHWHYAGLREGTGSIVTEGVKPKKLFQDLIKLVRDTQPNPHILSDIEDISSIYGGISEQRNQIIHWLWLSACGDKSFHWIQAPDYMRSKQGKQRDYTVEEVNKVAATLCTLFNRLVPHTMPESQLREFRAASGADADAIFPAPWLDKADPV